MITVSSIVHRFGRIDFDDLQWESRRYAPNRAYGQSKLANLLFAYELQRRLDRAGIAMLAAASHPGRTSTGLQRSAPRLRWLNPLFGMAPPDGALPTLYAATAEDVAPGGFYGPDGWAGLRGHPARTRSSAASMDEATAARLWQVSEDLVGVQCLSG